MNKSNRFDEDYQIRDNNGIIFKGCLDEMLYAWNVTTLNDYGLKQIYGKASRPKKWLIKEWEGSLELISILDKHPCVPGKHKWKKDKKSA